MFYVLPHPLCLNGTDQYLDLTRHLHHFLQTDRFSADIRFRTTDSGYPSLLAVYFKESMLPDFSLSLYKGLGTLTIRRNGALKILTGGEAVCDGVIHQLSFRGCQDYVQVWMDGRLIIEDREPGPWCQFSYVGFATLGRATRADQYTFFRGEILSAELSRKILPLSQASTKAYFARTTLFGQHDAGAENYRIPSLLTVGDLTIASADARMDAPGDNPNHICRAIRISTDSGESWEEIRIFCDYGGTGRDDGAAAIDGSLLYDRDTDTVFQLFSHTSRGIGAFTVSGEADFDELGRKLLWNEEGTLHYVEKGRIIQENGESTAYTADAYGNLFLDGVPVGSICHGENRIFRQSDSSFLQLIFSKDHGHTWSDPVDLNPMVKLPWMLFVGAGPGTGLQILEGQHAGRLLFPVYYHNRNKVASSGVIYSDDHGKTWHMGRSVNHDRIMDGLPMDPENTADSRANLGECQVTELPGGRVRIMLRNNFGAHTLTALSDDGGETWHSLRETTLPDPQCQSHILRIRHKKQDLWLFSNPANSNSRVCGTVRVSFDGGETWPVAKIIEPGEFAYSCMTLLPDGQIGLLYEGQNIHQRFMKFALEWLLDE